jgi:Protein of unknown function (DUF3237)
MPSSLLDNLPDVLSSARTRPLFVMRLNSRMQVIGPTSGCVRRVGVIFGGVFEGERLSGDVLDGGNDWQTIRGDSAVTLDVRLVLKTNDEAMIGMTYRGIRHGPPDILARIDRGEAVDPAAYYFRMSSEFETAAPRYDWLNRLLAVGVGHRTADGPIYSVFELL